MGLDVGLKENKKRHNTGAKTKALLTSFEALP
jgi:hypothetical protein